MRTKPDQRKVPPAGPAPQPPGIRRKRPWLRVGLVAVLLVLLGVAAYQLVLTYRARRHLRAAEQVEQRRDFQQASAHLADYLSLKPNDADVRLLAARTARRGGDFHGATEELEEYRQRRGRDAPL